MRCMKKKSISQCSLVCCSLARALRREGGLPNSRASTGLFVCLAGVFVVLFAFAVNAAPLQAQRLEHQRNRASDTVAFSNPVSSGTWTFTGSLNTARFEHTATLLL